MRQRGIVSMGLRIHVSVVQFAYFRVVIQYALVLASMHCSPMTCSSCADTP